MLLTMTHHLKQQRRNYRLFLVSCSEPITAEHAARYSVVGLLQENHIVYFVYADLR